MKRGNANEKIREMLAAKDGLIYVNTYEENAFVEELCGCVINMAQFGTIPEVRVYTPTSGMITLNVSEPNEIDLSKAEKGINNVIDALAFVQKCRNNISTERISVMDMMKGDPDDDEKVDNNSAGRSKIFIFKDLHQYLQQREVVRFLRDISEEYTQKTYCPIFVTAPFVDIPVELEKLFTLYEMPLMDKDDIEIVVSNTAGVIPGESCDEYIARKESLVNAFVGLTYREIIRAIFHCKARHQDKALRPEEIRKEKVAIVKKSGALDFVEPTHELSDLGGCEAFKNWIKTIKERLTPEAAKFGIPQPKGAMLVGVPGTSKTVSAEIMASYLGIPLLSLDMAKVMGSFVGQSEKQIANALRIAKAVSPCVLLLDECEKVLGGVASSSQSDAGTLSRVMSQLLNFLQEDNSGVITIMTSNDVSQLPPELTRTGRIDAQWMFDLPNKEERDEIVDIYLEKNNLEMNILTKGYFVAKTENFTGAEIKTAVGNIVISVFCRQKNGGVEDMNRIVLKEDIDESVALITPVYKSSREKIEAFRMFAKDRYLNASEPEKKAVKKPSLTRRKILDLPKKTQS